MVVDQIKLADIGPKFEHHDVFPARTNTGQSSFLIICDEKLMNKCMWCLYHFAMSCQGICS